MSIAQLQQALDDLRDSQVADDALTAVDAARRLRDLAEAAETDNVRAARSAGVAWSKLGKVYGLTKQGAQQRFRRHGEPKG